MIAEEEEEQMMEEAVERSWRLRPLKERSVFVNRKRRVKVL